MELKKAYQMVLNDLAKVKLFQGYYDAKNGNAHYMHGIETVMEYISTMADRPGYDKIFQRNKQKSIDKAK